MQVDPFKPTLKASGPNLLTLECDEPLLTFAFKFNLCRYEPGFAYDHLAITRNFVGSPHVDREDTSHQYALALGDYGAGGELVVVGPARYCSQRHRMSMDSRTEGSNVLLATS